MLYLYSMLLCLHVFFITSMFTCVESIINVIVEFTQVVCVKMSVCMMMMMMMMQ